MNFEQQLAALLQGGQAAASGPLLEFRCGRLTLSGTTVTADPRKGKLVFTDDQGLLKLEWSPRPSGHVEEHLIVFPGDVKVENVPECTTGRVVLLRFNSDPNKKLFFWMQDPNVENDEKNIKRMTELFDSGPGAAAAGGGGAASEQAQLLQMLGASSQSQSQAPRTRTASPARTAPAAASVATPAAAPQASAPPAVAASTEASRPVLSQAAADILARAAANLQAAQQAQNLSLGAIFDPELLIPLLEQDQDIVNAVMEHLPEGQRTPELLKEQLRSPQLQQTLNRLTLAFNQGQGAVILQQLGLSPNNSIGVESLLEALRNYASSNSSESKSKGDSMDVDKQ
jgi:hypothetical protein